MNVALSGRVPALAGVLAKATLEKDLAMKAWAWPTGGIRGGNQTRILSDPCRSGCHARSDPRSQGHPVMLTKVGMTDGRGRGPRATRCGPWYYSVLRKPAGQATGLTDPRTPPRPSAPRRNTMAPWSPACRPPIAGDQGDRTSPGHGSRPRGVGAASPTAR